MQSLIQNHMQQKHSDFSRAENITVNNNPAPRTSHTDTESHSEKMALKFWSHIQQYYNSYFVSTGISMKHQIQLSKVMFSDRTVIEAPDFDENPDVFV